MSSCDACPVPGAFGSATPGTPLAAPTGMPYASNHELPPAVCRHLPPHAQDIFREAFNHAWDSYGADEPRAFRVAWGAVKRVYVKVGDDWVLRSPAERR
jgi:cation transport regulator